MTPVPRMNRFSGAGLLSVACLLSVEGLLLVVVAWWLFFSPPLFAPSILMSTLNFLGFVSAAIGLAIGLMQSGREQDRNETPHAVRRIVEWGSRICAIFALVLAIPGLLFAFLTLPTEIFPSLNQT